MSRLVIVGGSKGIGRDVQPFLRATGHEVAVLPSPGHRPVSACEVNATGGATYLTDIATLHSAFPTEAILFCQRFRGAGEWEGEMSVSLRKTFKLMEWAATNLDTASVVMMSSVAASSVEDEQPVSYHVAKAGMEAMMRYYATTLAPRFRVNAIVPALTIKPEARAFYDANPELEATYKAITPLGRMGTVEDIANLVDFLISEKSSYMTGQTLTLDGGIGLRSQWNLARKVSPNLRDLNVRQKVVA